MDTIEELKIGDKVMPLPGATLGWIPDEIIKDLPDPARSIWAVAAVRDAVGPNGIFQEIMLLGVKYCFDSRGFKKVNKS